MKTTATCSTIVTIKSAKQVALPDITGSKMKMREEGNSGNSCNS